MKNLLILLLVTLLGVSICSAQSVAPSKPNVVLDANGNYIPIAEANKFTGKYFIDKDKTKHPVYITTTGKLFITSKSKKTGKEYRRYLKL